MRQGAESDFCEALDNVIGTHDAAGHRIKTIECDGEFKLLMEKVQDNVDVKINHTNAQDHQPRAERNNETFKESFRTASHATPHRASPRVMIMELAAMSTNVLNIFPAKHGTSSHHGPEVLVANKVLEPILSCKYSVIAQAILMPS